MRAGVTGCRKYSWWGSLYQMSKNILNIWILISAEVLCFLYSTVCSSLLAQISRTNETRPLPSWNYFFLFASANFPRETKNSSSAKKHCCWQKILKILNKSSFLYLGLLPFKIITSLRPKITQFSAFTNHYGWFIVSSLTPFELKGLCPVSPDVEKDSLYPQCECLEALLPTSGWIEGGWAIGTDQAQDYQILSSTTFTDNI